MEQENIFLQTGTHMKEDGKMEKQMEKEYISLKTEIYMKEISKIIIFLDKDASKRNKEILI